MVQVTFISRPTYMRSWSKIGRRESQLLLTIVGLTLRRICTSEPLKYTLVTRPSTRMRGCGYMRLGGRWGWGPWICQSYPMHMYHAHVHMYIRTTPYPTTHIQLCKVHKHPSFLHMDVKVKHLTCMENKPVIVLYFLPLW